MKDYNSYTAADLAIDAQFRAWVLQPTDENKEFWDRCVYENPALESTIQEAAALLRTVHGVYRDDLTEQIQEQQIANLFESRAPGKRRPLNSRFELGSWWYKMAAVWLIIGGLAGSYFLVEKRQSRISPLLEAAQASKIIIKRNISGKPMTVLLGDGSVIVLENGSTLRYPEKFEDSERSVFLDGQAFFDIAKDPAHPFLVFSEATVTRVLGTSFRIESNAKQVLVAVKSGKVSVKRIPSTTSTAADGVFLIPNEQVIFNSVDQIFEKSAVRNPQKITSVSDKQELGFDETAASEVFRTLERNYDIHIEFDESRFSTCRITTQFTDETLRQRLQAICEVTGTHFKITDGQVMIEGSCGQ
jgi:transmembrane sensor